MWPLALLRKQIIWKNEAKEQPMAQPEYPRGILQVTGDDRISFMQSLVTNNISSTGLHYTALLTPQGKFFADFFVLVREGDILIDVADTLQPSLLSRLSMYRLRAKVDIAPMECPVNCGLGPVPEGAFQDPRTPAMGWRAYGVQDSDVIDWQALRVAHIIPETGIELEPDRFILEMGFERLNGVDFKKGCYVGQEIVARMKHKTNLRKGLCQVKVSGITSPGTTIIANGKSAGVIYTQHDGLALAYLRFDRITDQMTAGDAIVTV
jgi:folate-binding protein YgfZ